MTEHKLIKISSIVEPELVEIEKEKTPTFDEKIQIIYRKLDMINNLIKKRQKMSA